MKRLFTVLLCLCLLSPPASAVSLRRDDDITLPAPSAILMERSTGTVLYEKNADARLSPASVTKVMTMLLVAEAVDSGELSLDDQVVASARAASMGGSQIWLEEGESMSVGEMLKCVAVVSANDCCVALAELLAGSEEAFAARMNQRAAELGMENSHFLSCSGLTDSDEHYTSARDIALMSRQLLEHPWIRDYTTVWMDTIRGGEFGLSNTNKLIYYYPGATGLKTGFTSKAMYCLSASAEREGVEYIAVVLHCASSAERFESAKTLLSYGFANYTLLPAVGEEPIPSVRVLLGQAERVQPVPEPGANLLVEKGGPGGKLRWELELPEEVPAPVEAGTRLGCIRLYRGDELLRETALLAAERVGKLGVLQIAGRLLTALVADPPAPEGENQEPGAAEDADWGLKNPENGDTIQ